MNESVRTWGLRLLALAIAVGVWFSVSLEDRVEMSERSVQASVSYNLPRGFMILDPIDIVTVRLRGTERAISRLSPFVVDVQVEISQTERGLEIINLQPDDVRRPDGLEVVSIEPNALSLEIDSEKTERLPVEPELEGEPAAGALAGPPESIPSHVLVTGPESLLSKVDALSTQPVDLDGHALTFEETVQVLTPDPLIKVVQPAKVTVRVPLEPPPTASDGDRGDRAPGGAT